MTKHKVLKESDAVLNLIVHELTTVHNCHTIILYGSRARGDYTSTSDYDVVGISQSEAQQRIARLDPNHNVYFDIFIYPESEFSTLKADHLRMADGLVITEHNGFGEKLIAKLKDMEKTPELISDDEIQARKVWYQKMLARSSIKDLEGKYRHIWTIFALLEDYFVFRKLRYQGPKKAFQYLTIYDAKTLALFNDALSNPSDIEILDKLIKGVVDL